MSPIMHESSLSSLSSSVCLFVALDDLDPVSGSRLTRELEVGDAVGVIVSAFLLSTFCPYFSSFPRIKQSDGFVNTLSKLFSQSVGRRQMRSRRRKCFFLP